jgi:hypothetical protein
MINKLILKVIKLTKFMLKTNLLDKNSEQSSKKVAQFYFAIKKLLDTILKKKHAPMGRIQMNAYNSIRVIIIEAHKVFKNNFFFKKLLNFTLP